MRNDNILKIYQRFLYTCATLVLLSGIIYLEIQWIFTRDIKDKLFVFFSIGASILILCCAWNILNFIRKNEMSFCAVGIDSLDLDTNRKEYDKLLFIFIDYRLAIPFGIIWGVAASYIPFYFDIWPTNSIVAFAFSFFLFCNCFITGFYLLNLVRYFFITKNLWDLIEVELWKRDKRAADFLLPLSKKTSLLASLYISITLMAWITTPFVPFTKELISYLIFAVVLLIASVVLPIRPFSSKLKKEKHLALYEIDEKIQKEYIEIIRNLKVDKEGVNYDTMNLLLEMRKKIEDIHIYPYRIKTISASFSIIIISLLPVFVQMFLEKYLKW
jgi:hypothetical protein